MFDMEKNLIHPDYPNLTSDTPIQELWRSSHNR